MKAAWILVPALVFHASGQEPMPKLSITALLAFNQGGLILVDPLDESAWTRTLANPELADLFEDLLVRTLHVGDKNLEALGISNRGGYLLSRKGEVLAQWPGGPPADLRSALLEAGHKSLEGRFLDEFKLNPDRVDLAWALFERAHSRWAKFPVKVWSQVCVDSVNRLLDLADWGAGGQVFMDPTIHAPDSPESAPLREIADKRLHDVQALLRKCPSSIAGWRMFAFLWSYGSNPPNIAKFIEELEPAPDSNLADWPLTEAIRMAEKQLRVKKDWAGMRAFAQRRLDKLEEQAHQYSPTAADEWSGELRVTSTKVTRTTRREAARAGIGIWLALLFEADVEEGRTNEARLVAHRILTEGDAMARIKAHSIARSKGLTALADLLCGDS